MAAIGYWNGQGPTITAVALEVLISSSKKLQSFSLDLPCSGGLRNPIPLFFEETSTPNRHPLAGSNSPLSASSPIPARMSLAKSLLPRRQCYSPPPVIIPGPPNDLLGTDIASVIGPFHLNSWADS